eukprot:gene14649-31163_t
MSLSSCVAFVAAAGLLGTASAFSATSRRPISSTKISMSAAKELYGALPPFGFFDPLGISTGKSPEE